MSTINPHTTRAAGTILTAAIYNSDHVNHITNAQALNADKLEGATPPVVDGHAVLWFGTTGAALKTAGYIPANQAISVTAAASGGLTGGGDLSANRTLSADFADQATAEAASSAVKVMSPLRVRHLLDHANAKASQAEAEAAATEVKWMSPLRWRQAFNHANQKANQAEAEAGADDTKWLSSLRVKQSVLVHAPSSNSSSTSSSETNYPIGQSLLAFSAAGSNPAPNSNVAVFRGISAAWVINLDSNGTQLTGTWRARGSGVFGIPPETSISYTLVQRVA